jgi:hypothetical protein
MIYAVFVVVARILLPFVHERPAVVLCASVMYTALYALAALSHIRCMLTNPGMLITISQS